MENSGSSQIPALLIPDGTIAQSSSSSQNDQKPNGSRQFSCPFCDFVSDKLVTLQTHIESSHLTSSPRKEEHQKANQPEQPVPCSDIPTLICPMCECQFEDAAKLELHVDEEHILPPAKRRKTPSPLAPETEDVEGACGLDLSCPICSSRGFSNSESLALHVEEHFNDEAAAAVLDDDAELARQIEENHRKEEEEFRRLQRIYGFDGRTADQQTSEAMTRSVQRGNMSVVEYHEKRIMLKVAEREGVDDASSATRDVISRLKTLCIATQRVQRVHLCSSMDHYASSLGDSGWGCGYRNFQMMLSSLLRLPQYVERLKRICTNQSQNECIQVPSITRLQVAIEDAWMQGFDPEGRDQLGGKVIGTKKWIGATEIASVLALCRIRYRLIDFHRPTSSDGTQHPALFEWVLNYFRESSDFKPPLYFQHQGHSRTIVGVEELANSKLRLLVLDPSHKQVLMRPLMSESSLQPPALKKIRILLTGLKEKQYQIVCIEKGFVTSDREYIESRLLRSLRIPE